MKGSPTTMNDLPPPPSVSLEPQLAKPAWSRKFGTRRVTSKHHTPEQAQYTMTRDFIKLTEAGLAEISRSYRPGDTVRISLYVEGTDAP